MQARPRDRGRNPVRTRLPPRPGRPGLALGLALSLALWHAPAAGAQQAEAAFGRGLARISDHMDRGRWDAALLELHALLADHARQPYATLRLDDLRNAQATCTFHRTYEPPHPRALVAGELQAWDAADGAIALRYDRRALQRAGHTDLPISAPASLRMPAGDFEASGGMLLHPLVFDGPYTVTVRGRRLDALRELPPAWRLRSARVVVLREDHGFHEVLAGFPGGGHGKIRSIDLDRRRELDDRQRDNLDLADEGAYRFVVRVDARRITAALDGVAFLSADNEQDRFGGVGLSGFPHVTSVVIAGDSDGRWIADLLTTHRAAARAAFDQRYDPDRDLPDWLVGEVPDGGFRDGGPPDGDG